MFNLSKQKTAQVKQYEKYLREDNISPKLDEDSPITEKNLKHRDEDTIRITEKQMSHDKTSDAKIIEKVLNEASGYVVHRTDKWDMPVMPINALVEKMQQDRVASDYNVEKEPHWSLSFDDKKQNGKLPKWPKSPDQHSGITLGNDPRRFEGIEGLPVHADQKKNDAERNKKPNVKPLIGGITTEAISKVADNIKSGASVDYDTAILAILRESEKEKRELTPVEQKTISELKIARTNALLQK